MGGSRRPARGWVTQTQNRQTCICVLRERGRDRESQTLCDRWMVCFYEAGGVCDFVCAYVCVLACACVNVCILTQICVE